MYDEGYTKYKCHWTKTNAHEVPQELISSRDIMYSHQLIGYHKELSVGYGNISCRTVGNRFLISGTQTGHLEQLSPKHFSLVTDFNLESNEVFCSGPIQASSETLTHAALYSVSEHINAVIHIHNVDMWKTHKNSLPTSDEAVPYGTPAMAKEMARLFRDTQFSEIKIAVMGGHYEGLIAFGSGYEEVVGIVLKYKC